MNDEMDPKCKYSEWRYVNNNEERDFVCVKWTWCGAKECYADKYCRYYEPEDLNNDD